MRLSSDRLALYPGWQSKGDVFGFADQIIEKWYPTVDLGNKKGVVLLVTTAKEAAVAGGPEFNKVIGDDLLEAIISENLPGENQLIS